MQQILQPDWLLTLEGDIRIETGQAVCVADGLIAAIGTPEQLQALYPQAQTVALPGRLLMPGLVNAHAHAAMNLFRGIGDDLPLMRWLQERIWPLEGAFVSDPFVFDGTVLACAEMLQGGITTFNDMYFFPGAAARAARAMGQRIVAGVTTIEFPTAYATNADDYLNKGLAARDEFKGEAGVHWALAPHAPYTITDETFRKVLTLADQLDLPIHLHLAETAHEVADALSRTGLRPVDRLNGLGLINERLLAVHGVHLNDPELDLMAQRGCKLAHCPASNLKLASGIAPVANCLDRGLTVAIGTDSAASNNRLDLFAETRLASLLAKGISGAADRFSAEQAVQAATLGGARAIGLENQLGSLKPGKQADVIAVEIATDAYTQPAPNLLSHLVYVADRRDVSDVWVAGKRVVENRQLHADAADLLSETLLNRVPMWQTRFQAALASA
jgi:5-methylthioadenosine/S-adenosylhomocysteine deaminase